MSTLITLLIVAVYLALGFLGAPLFVWSAAILGTLWWMGAPLWLLIVVAVPLLFFNIPILRALLVSKYIAAYLRKSKLLPRISETERVALEAGTVWMDGELFSGKPSAKKLLGVDEKPMEERLRAFLDGPCERLCELVDDWEYWRKKDLSDEAWQYIKDAGFLGLIVPTEYGGMGFGASELSAVIHKLASRSFPLSVTVMIPNSLGPAELLHHYGTPEQKTEYLPKLATGEHVPCFALTEPAAGSDAGAIQARGTVFKDAADGELKIRLNWDKRYTSLATLATVIGLAFKLDDPENLLGKGKKPGITCALIPADLPGIERDLRHDPLGVPFHNCVTRGQDVVVGVDTIIGGPDFAGQGWRMLMGVPRRRSRHRAACRDGRERQDHRPRRRRLRHAALPVRPAGRLLRRHRRAALAHRRPQLSARGRPALHQRRDRPGRQAFGDLGDREAAFHRALAPDGHGRHGHPRRSRHLRADRATSWRRPTSPARSRSPSRARTSSRAA